MMWPKKPTWWTEEGTVYVSVPFTWNLPSVAAQLRQRSFLYDRAVVGGPAVELMPEYLADIPNVEIGHDSPGVLQRVNPRATRTTLGCPNHCAFCGIGQGLIEPGGFRELDDWPDLPVVCDNNLLAASDAHFDRVLDRLLKHENVDFNQGLDSRLLTRYHAARLGELDHPTIRLALDHWKPYAREVWDCAFARLRGALIPKRRIAVYCLIGWRDTPQEAWTRCQYIETRGVLVCPLWFHPLDALEWNGLSTEQVALGWTHEHCKHIMSYYYQHRGVPLLAGM